jgi:hypothetical protein
VLRRQEPRTPGPAAPLLFNRVQRREVTDKGLLSDPKDKDDGKAAVKARAYRWRAERQERTRTAKAMKFTPSLG